MGNDRLYRQFIISLNIKKYVDCIDIYRGKDFIAVGDTIFLFVI